MGLPLRFYDPDWFSFCFKWIIGNFQSYTLSVRKNMFKIK